MIDFFAVLCSMAIILIPMFVFAYSGYLLVKLHDWICSKREKKYLKEKRPDILKKAIPECIYMPCRTYNPVSFLERYASGNSYLKRLGCFQFHGKYQNIVIDDMLTVTKHTGSDDTDDDYESIVFDCTLPENNIVSQLGEISVRQTGRVSHNIGKFISKLETKLFDRLGVTKIDADRYFLLGDTNLEVVFPPDTDMDGWLRLFEHGLSEKIIAVFDTYRDAVLYYQQQEIIFSINVTISGEFLSKKNDFMVSNINRICNTITILQTLY